MNGSLRNPASGGVLGVGSNLTRKQMMTRTDGEEGPESPLGLLNGKPIMGPARPPRTSDAPLWSFDGLNDSALADEVNAGKARDDLSDASSMVVGHDEDSAIGGDDTDYQAGVGLMGHDNNYDTRIMSGLAGAGTPDRDTDMQYNGYAFPNSGNYEDVDDAGALHLEDAGFIGGQIHSPPAIEIHNEDDMEGLETLPGMHGRTC